MTSFKDFVATSASICTILQLLVPIWICRKYVKDESTKETSSLPFAIGLLSSCLWLGYGMLQSEHSLIIVNSIGVILQTGYLCVFFKYCDKRKFLYIQMGSIGGVFLLVVLYSLLDTNPERCIYRVGIMCSLVTVAFFAAPLSQLAYVIDKKNSGTLPLELIAMTFASSLLWLIYGFIIHDRFVQIPNIMGTALSAAQLSLFVIYPPKDDSVVADDKKKK